MSATDQLSQHERHIAEAQQRVQALGRDLAELGGKVAELKDERINAFADQDERKAGQLAKKIADLQAKEAEVDERRAGAERAARRAADEDQKFVSERYADLIAELSGDAKRAAAAVDQSAERLLAALDAWGVVGQRVSELLGLAGQARVMRVPDNGWGDLARGLRRDRPRPTVPPLPREWATMSIPAVDDPDAAVRQEARQKAQAG